MTPTAGRALTTPTGAQLGAAFTDEAVGYKFPSSLLLTLQQQHTQSHVTAAASGVTLVGSAANCC
jgi:hypothetical protein